MPDPAGGWTRSRGGPSPPEARSNGKTDPRPGLARVDEVERAAVQAPAQPVRLGHPVQRGRDTPVRLQPVQGARLGPPVGRDCAGPEPARRVAGAVVEPGIGHHPRRAQWAALGLAVRPDQPEPVRGGQHVPAAGPRRGRTDRGPGGGTLRRPPRAGTGAAGQPGCPPRPGNRPPHPRTAARPARPGRRGHLPVGWAAGRVPAAPRTGPRPADSTIPATSRRRPRRSPVIMSVVRPAAREEPDLIRDQPIGTARTC